MYLFPGERYEVSSFTSAESQISLDLDEASFVNKSRKKLHCDFKTRVNIANKRCNGHTIAMELGSSYPRPRYSEPRMLNKTLLDWKPTKDKSLKRFL